MTIAIIVGSILAVLALAAGGALTLMRRGVGKEHTFLAPAFVEGDPDEEITMRVKEFHPLPKLLSVLSFGRARAVCDGKTLYLADGDLGPSDERGAGGVLHELGHRWECLLECADDAYEFLARISGQWIVGFYWNGRWEREARAYAKRTRDRFVIQYTQGHFWRKVPVPGGDTFTWVQL